MSRLCLGPCASISYGIVVGVAVDADANVGVDVAGAGVEGEAGVFEVVEGRGGSDVVDFILATEGNGLSTEAAAGTGVETGFD